VFGSAATRPHSADPMDRLIQHICADMADRPITVDLDGFHRVDSHAMVDLHTRRSLWPTILISIMSNRMEHASGRR
jgi:hypothetical protein